MHGLVSSARAPFVDESKLPAYTYLTIAVAAVDRSTLAWFEWYGSRFTTSSANSREHLAAGCIAEAAGAVAAFVAVAAVAGAFCFPCLAAFGAAFRFVGITSRTELFLLLNAERKGIVAVVASEGLVLKTHWMASSLNNLVRARVIQYFVNRRDSQEVGFNLN